MNGCYPLLLLYIGDVTDSGPHFPPPEPVPSAAPIAPAVPPIEPPPTGLPQAYPPPAPLSTYPPPQAMPMQAPVPGAFLPPAPRKGLRPAAILGIVLGGLVVLVALIVGGVALTNYIAGFLSGPVAQAPIPQPDPVRGAPGSPIAATPDTCPDVCFTHEDIGNVIPSSDELGAIGLVTPYSEWGDYPWSSVVREFSLARDSWKVDEGSPTECFFVYTRAPVALPLDSPPDRSDGSIEFTEEIGNDSGSSGLIQSARLFDTSAAAVAHMRSLDEALASCSGYDTTYGSSVVTAAAALSVPANIAVIGWVEDSAAGRYYVLDMQRSNMVVRSSLFSVGDISEVDFREFVSGQAENFAIIAHEAAAESTEASGCKISCFTIEQLATIAPPVSDLGLSADPSYVISPPSQYQDLWNAAHGTSSSDPETCFFDRSAAPIDTADPFVANEEDPVVDQGRFTDGITVLTQSTRVYSAELYAARHTGSLRSPIIQCENYTLDVNGVSHAVSVEVNSISPDNPTAKVAAWTSVDAGTTRHVADIQYRNLVTRIVVEGDVTDEQFEAYVLDVVQQLQTLR